MNTENLGVVASSPLFQGIERADLPDLLKCLAARTKSYLKNEIIYHVGQEGEHVGLVCSGGVQVIKEDFMGNRTILAKLAVGDLFGEAFACLPDRKLTVSVQAVADSEIMLMHYRRIVSICPSACGFHGKMVENMLGILAEKNLMLNQKIEVLSKRSTREKLIAYLSEQAGKAESNSFTIPFDRQELADYLCVDRSAMSGELSKMRQEGLLRYDRSKFQLLTDG